jgi:hypothetical protein
MKIGAEHTHRVDLMPVEVGWELLWKSMNIREENELQSLRNIGIEIVRKCGCLLLGAKVTASVLASTDQTENEWKKILSNPGYGSCGLSKVLNLVIDGRLGIVLRSGSGRTPGLALLLWLFNSLTFYILCNEHNVTLPNIWDGSQLKLTFRRNFNSALMQLWYELEAIANNISFSGLPDALIW